MTSKGTSEHSFELPALPERVWAALTTPARLAAWFMPNDLEAVPGHRFQLRPGLPELPTVITGEVLAVRPGRRLDMRWEVDGAQLVVSWQVEAAVGGSLLRVVRYGCLVDEGQDRALEADAAHRYGDRLRTVLRSGMLARVALVPVQPSEDGAPGRHRPGAHAPLAGTPAVKNQATGPDPMTSVPAGRDPWAAAPLVADPRSWSPDVAPDPSGPGGLDLSGTGGLDLSGTGGLDLSGTGLSVVGVVPGSGLVSGSGPALVLVAAAPPPHRRAGLGVLVTGLVVLLLVAVGGWALAVRTPPAAVGVFRPGASSDPADVGRMASTGGPGAPGVSPHQTDESTPLAVGSSAPAPGPTASGSPLPGGLGLQATATLSDITALSYRVTVSVHNPAPVAQAWHTAGVRLSGLRVRIKVIVGDVIYHGSASVACFIPGANLSTVEAGGTAQFSFTVSVLVGSVLGTVDSVALDDPACRG